MRRFFPFREVSPGETSPVTWGLKRQRIKGQVFKIFLLAGYHQYQTV
jgi:hypothetical protein